jgi:hypothetical protein
MPTPQIVPRFGVVRLIRESFVTSERGGTEFRIRIFLIHVVAEVVAILLRA